ncbi:hypothetical protein BH11MYX3_BH11MYX3_48120 [soil metagenome]
MRTLVVTVVLACTGCTLLMPAALSGATAIHNGIAADENHWNYTKPILIGAALGLVIDFLLGKEFVKSWAKPMT